MWLEIVKWEVAVAAHLQPSSSELHRLDPHAPSPLLTPSVYRAAMLVPTLEGPGTGFVWIEGKTFEFGIHTVGDLSDNLHSHPDRSASKITLGIMKLGGAG